MKIRKTLIQCLVVSVFCGILSTVAAQELSPIEMVKRYPPGKGIFNKEGVELAQQMLEWQIKRGEAQREVLADEISQLKHQIEQIDKSTQSEEGSQPQEFRYATDSIREQLIGRCLQKLLDVRVEIAANNAMLGELEKALDASDAKSRKADAAAQSRKAQMQLLLEQIKILEREITRIEQLKKRGVVSEKEGQEARLRVLTLRGELAKLDQAEKVQENEGASKLAARASDLRLETRRLSAFEEAAQRQLEQIAKSAKVAREMKKHQREQQQLEQRLSMRIDRHEKVLADIEEAKVLLKQIQNSRETNKSDSPNGSKPEN